MKLRNVLIVVKDIEKSKKFYHDLLDVYKRQVYGDWENKGKRTVEQSEK